MLKTHVPTFQLILSPIISFIKNLFVMSIMLGTNFAIGERCLFPYDNYLLFEGAGQTKSIIRFCLWHSLSYNTQYFYIYILILSYFITNMGLTSKIYPILFIHKNINTINFIIRLQILTDEKKSYHCSSKIKKIKKNILSFISHHLVCIVLIFYSPYFI